MSACQICNKKIGLLNKKVWKSMDVLFGFCVLFFFFFFFFENKLSLLWRLNALDPAGNALDMALA